MWPWFFVAAALSSPAQAYPLTPTVLVYRARDYAGKTYPNVTVKTYAGRLRVEAFGQALVYDGKSWSSENEVPEEAAAVAVFQAAIRPAGEARRDAFDRPVLIPALPAGKRTARVDYRYDEVGLLAANLVFSDGSGFQFRRFSALPGAFTPADFEPPRKVEPEGAAETSPAGPGSASPDFAGVARLTALLISDREQAEFEKSGAVGRYRLKTR